MAIILPGEALAPIAPKLAAMLAADTLPHALLLEGSSEAVRREAAVALARALLCEGGSGEGETEMFGGVSLFGEEAAGPKEDLRPCEACSHCRKTAADAHADLQVLAGGQGSRSFHIDAIRALRLDAAVLPNEANVKVYVLHNAQAMTVEAQNALLKLLEEPPDYVCLILTATARKLLLQTVISRVTAFSLGEAVEEALDAQREALLQAHAGRIAQALLRPKNAYALLEVTAPLEGDRDLVRELLPCLRRQLHAMLLENTEQAPRILMLMDGVKELIFALERNANLNLLVTRLAAMAMNN